MTRGLGIRKRRFQYSKVRYRPQHKRAPTGTVLVPYGPWSQGSNDESSERLYNGQNGSCGSHDGVCDGGDDNDFRIALGQALARPSTPDTYLIERKSVIPTRSPERSVNVRDVINQPNHLDLTYSFPLEPIRPILVPCGPTASSITTAPVVTSTSDPPDGDGDDSTSGSEAGTEDDESDVANSDISENEETGIPPENHDGPDDADPNDPGGYANPVSYGNGLLEIPPLEIWALLQTTGHRKLSCEQFQSARGMLQTLPMPEGAPKAASHLPHYRTISRRLKPLVLDNLALPATLVEFPIDTSVPGGKANRMPGPENKCRLSYVSLWEYARADMRNPIFFERLQRNVLHERTKDVDMSPLVYAREWFYGEPTFIGVDDALTPIHTQFAESDETIKCTLRRRDVLPSLRYPRFTGPHHEYIHATPSQRKRTAIPMDIVSSHRCAKRSDP